MRTVLVTLAAAAALACTASASPSYVLLVSKPMRVYSSLLSSGRVECPTEAFPVSTRDPRTAARAVLLAVPKLYSGDRETDTRDAHARATLAPHASRGRADYARCGRAVWLKTIQVDVGFPHVTRSQSMSSASFFVARLRDGWLIWHQVH